MDAGELAMYVHPQCEFEGPCFGWYVKGHYDKELFFAAVDWYEGGAMVRHQVFIMPSRNGPCLCHDCAKDLCVMLDGELHGYTPQKLPTFEDVKGILKPQLEGGEA